MNATHDEAQKVAEGLPVGFTGIEILVLIEIVYYAFLLWKSCHGSSQPPGEYLATERTRSGDFTPYIIKHAARHMKRAARYKGQHLTDEQLQTLTVAALSHVAAADAATVAACCAEPCEAELESVYSSTEDES